jgi:hypothetical protein
MNEKSGPMDAKLGSWRDQYGDLEDEYSMDRTEVFSKLLKSRGAPPVQRPVFSLEDIDEFLKEAYKIVSLALQ